MSSTSAIAEPPRQSLLALSLRRFLRRPAALAALIALLALIVIAVCAPLLAPAGWSEINLDNVHAAPSLAHLFGTDNVGRDVLTRTLYGTRTTLEIALAATAIATLIGVVTGTAAGLLAGSTDALLMRVADLVTAFPAVVLTLAAIVYFRPVYPHTLLLIYAAIMWAVVARVVRAHLASLRGTPFVEAARALGASNTRIAARHLLPNAAGTIAVAATALIGQIVLLDATIEFFNYGLPESTQPSLGNLIADTVKFKFGLSNDPASAGYGWWTWLFPGLILILILTTTNLLGDLLDETLNPTISR